MAVVVVVEEEVNSVLALVAVNSVVSVLALVPVSSVVLSVLSVNSVLTVEASAAPSVKGTFLEDTYWMWLPSKTGLLAVRADPDAIRK